MTMAAEVTHSELTTVSSSPEPLRIPVPEAVIRRIPDLRASLETIKGDLTLPSVQATLKEALSECPEWVRWVASIPSPVSLRPTVISSGLEIERDDDFARKILVGLALTIQPDSYVPPYRIGNLAVTEVIARPDSTTHSHSRNDLPAPPHCAGFFEELPPKLCFFACVRPHSGGGAATTVVDLDRVLLQAPPILIEEWQKTYLLKTSRRFGEEIKPFQLLNYIDGLPFLRYRKEYTVGFESFTALRQLEELLSNPANHYVVNLSAGETLIHWNGSPHSRTEQQGATPEDPAKRRKLIRCRSVPDNGWEKNFQGDLW